MKIETKLTTVKIIKSMYSEFKHISLDSDFTLQKLVNRTIHQYIKNNEYRKGLNEYLELQSSGSKF